MDRIDRMVLAAAAGMIAVLSILLVADRSEQSLDLPGVTERPALSDSVEIMSPNRRFHFTRGSTVTIPFAWKWKSGREARPSDEFILEVARDPNFRSLILREFFLGEDRFDAEVAVDQTLYYRVRAKSGGQSPVGEIVAEFPRPPSLISAQRISSTHLQLELEGAPPHARFRLQVARDRDFTQLVVDRFSTVPRELLPLPSGHFFVRAQTLFDIDQVISDWSSPISTAPSP